MANSRDELAERIPKCAAEKNLELIDYLQVIWRWRYIVLSGPLFFSLVAGVLCAFMPKVYEIRAVVKPGVRAIDPAGSISYVDEPGNIMASIRIGEFNAKILESVKNSNRNHVPTNLSFDAKPVAGSEALEITYLTGDVDFGLWVVRELLQALSQEYGDRIEYLRSEYDSKIFVKKTEVSLLDWKRQALERRSKDVQTRIDYLQGEIVFSKKSAMVFFEKRDGLKSQGDSDRNALYALLYTNTYQQNMALSNDYQKRLDDYLQEKEEAKLQAQQLDRSRKLLDEKINGLELKKKIMTNLEVLREPASSGHPVKPKTKQIVLVAGVVGFFLMVFFVYLLESINNYRRRMTL